MALHKLLRNFALLLGLALGAAGVAAQPAPPPAPSARLVSPDGRLVFEITTDNDGRAGWTLTRDGRPVVDRSALGFILAGAPKLERNFRITAAVTGAIDDRWEQPWGERRFVTNRANTLRVTLGEGKAPGRALVVEARLFDTGLGFRYELPAMPDGQPTGIIQELTEFAIHAPATAWWIPGGEWNRYEYLYNRTPLAEVAQAHTPLTIRTDQGLHLAIHEAALVDYAGMWLRRVEGQRLKAALSPAAAGPPVTRTGALRTPWRVVLVAQDAPQLYAASDIILNLNEPNALGDVSWVKPHKYAGVWWEMHLDTKSWSSGPKHGATNANVRRHIDFAAANGLRSVLVEGWNAGWESDWFATGDAFSFTRAYPDFDLPALADYARAKGIRLMGHHETSGNIAHYEPQLAAALDLYAAHGIDAVKTGYVADAGGIQARGPDGRVRFEWHDGQVMSRHHLHVVEEAAKRRISVNPHEPIKDTGLRRTWPNWVSREGARGMEYNAWGNPPNPPSHEPTLVFTRMLAGPFDYTPGILSLEGRGQRLQSTLARQLALYVTLYSPIQMVPDLPEHYARHDAAFEFIRRVPTDWHESRVLSGEVGEHAVIARRDRAGPNWYLGAIADDAARMVTVRLDFLEPGVRYRMRLWRDGDGADWRSAPFDMVIEEREVTASDQLAMRLGAGGGAAAEFRPLGNRR